MDRRFVVASEMPIRSPVVEMMWSFMDEGRSVGKGRNFPCGDDGDVLNCKILRSPLGVWSIWRLRSLWNAVQLRCCLLKVMS